MRFGRNCLALAVLLVLSSCSPKKEGRYTGLSPAEILQQKPIYEEHVLPDWLDTGGGSVCTFSASPTTGQIVASPMMYSRTLGPIPGGADIISISFANLGTSPAEITEVAVLQCENGTWTPTASLPPNGQLVRITTPGCVGQTLAPTEGCSIGVTIAAKPVKSKVELRGTGGVVLFEFAINVHP